MSVLRNPRHERFAQELAKGKSTADAYVAAGFKPSRANASRLQHQDNISQRVSEILKRRERIEEKATERAIARTAITCADVLEMLIEHRKLARERGQTAAAIRAAELLGKEIGMFINREEVGKPGDFSHLSCEELERRIFDRLVAGGVPEKYARAFIELGEQTPRSTASRPHLRLPKPH